MVQAQPQPAQSKRNVFLHPASPVGTTSSELTEAIGNYNLALEAEREYLESKNQSGVSAEIEKLDSWYLDDEHKRLHKAAKSASRKVLSLVRS